MADYTGVDFHGGSFDGKNFESMSLARANLRGASFVNCNFRGAVFTGADVAGADFTNADLLTARLSGVTNLALAKLDGAAIYELTGVDLRGGNLSKARIGAVKAYGANPLGAARVVR